MKLARRDFLKNVMMGLVGLPALVVAGVSFAAKILVPDTDPVAKALNYTHDASKATLRTKEKMGIAAKDQLCSNCSFFIADGELDGAKVGKCTMITTGLVKAGGWCNSWTKKA